MVDKKYENELFNIIGKPVDNESKTIIVSPF